LAFYHKRMQDQYCQLTMAVIPARIEAIGMAGVPLK